MKKREVHAYIIMFGLIMAASILTWVIPAGNFTRVFDSDLNRELLVAGSFQYVESTPVSIWKVFVNIFRGFVESAEISFFLIFAYGYINLLMESNALEAYVDYLLVNLQGKDTFIIAIFMILFAICGSTLGMYEEVLGFVPVFMAIFISLGYDKIVGGSIVIIGSGVGFAASTINPFSIGLASNIAGIPLITPEVFLFRVIAFIIFITISIVYIINYARKMRTSPDGDRQQKDDYHPDNDCIHLSTAKIDIRKKLSLLSFALIIVLIGIGVICFDFYINEIAAVFFIFMLLVGKINRISMNEICEKFIDSSKEMVFTVLMLGFGRAIQVIITDGNIIDTIIHHLAQLVTQLPRELAGISMLIIQNILCLFVPSGSGQAIISMPILAL